MSPLAAVARFFYSKNHQRAEAYRSRIRRAFKRRRGFTLEPLEPRLLMSGDTVINLAAGVNDAVVITQVDSGAADGGLIFDVNVNGTITRYGDSASGIDSLTLDLGDGNDTVELASWVDPATSKSHFELPLTITGGSGDDSLIGADVVTEWTINGAGSGFTNGNLFTFSGFENLTGGEDDDNFIVLNGGSITGMIDGGGGAGADVITGPDDLVNHWVVSAADAGTLGSQHFQNIGSLIGGTQVDEVVLGAAGSLSGMVDGGSDDADAVDVMNLQALGSVTVDLQGGVVTAGVTIVVGEFIGFDRIEASTAATAHNTLMGPGEGNVHQDWHITGLNAGNVNGVEFSGFENLTGVSLDASDAFYFDAGGSLTGLVDGGTGTYDSFAVIDSNGDYTVYNPSSVEASGTQTLNGVTINFAGMDKQDFLGGTEADRVISGTSFADTITLEKSSTPGYMVLRFDGTEIYDETTDTLSDTFEFVTPSDSLTIEGGTGEDVITVNSVDDNFAAELYIYGNHGDAPTVIPDTSTDSVIFAGSVNTHGNYLEVFAEDITINSGTETSHVTLDAGAGDIVFRARRIGTADLENFLPIFANLKSVSIDVGEYAELVGNGVYLIAQAESRSLSEMSGASRLTSTFVIQPLVDKGVDLASLPIKVLVNQAEASVTLQDYVKITAADTVGVYATAGTDASGVASSKLFALGYAQADSTATISVGEHVVIDGGGAVNLTSDASAIADISSATSRDMGAVKLDNSKQFAFSLAVSNANVTSITTVAETASIHAGTTLNVRALGSHESNAEAESGIFSNGVAGIALALQFSNEDVQSIVNGKLQADMVHPDGAVVKLEFDPDEAVDYDNDTILGGSNWVVVTEDTVNYQNRRGGTIGGLTSGQDYYIVRVGDDLVKLAETEQKAIDAAAWEAENEGSSERNPYTIDLTQNTAESTLNTLTFDAADVSGGDDTVTVQVPAARYGFELGQKVIYKELDFPDDETVGALDDGTLVYADADGTPLLDDAGAVRIYTPQIAGLVHGTGYWVVVGPTPGNLPGDPVGFDQTIKLAALENEGRGNLFIDIGDAPEGKSFSLSAVQVLDSNFATFGVTTGIDATDTASASAGLTSADNADATFFPKGKSDWGSVAFGDIFGKLYDRYKSSQENASKKTAAQGSSGAGSSISLAGALAFSFTDHDALTQIGGTADLNSADDMELRSELVQTLRLSAEADNSPQEQTAKFKPGASADTGVSVAVIVGVENNSARAIIESGADLDAMRALRLISTVTYPFLTRPDEIIPLSASAASDMFRTDGYDAVNNFLNPSDLVSGLFNTWARSTAKAEEIGIGGSVNVMVFTNVAESIVESGVNINQDSFYRPDHEDPADNDNDQTSGTGHSNNANNLDEHVVSIEAAIYMQMMDVTGIFNFELPGIDTTPLASDGEKSFNMNPLGSNAARGGIGGAIYLNFLDNTTKAVVQDGANLYTGARKGLNFKAEEAILNFAFSQAGATAGKYAIAGTFAYAQQDSDILAQIESGANIQGGRIDIYAGSLDSRINWVGSVAKGSALGLGISAGIINLDRKTTAILGDQSSLDTSTAEAGAADGLTSNIDLATHDAFGLPVNNAIDVRAKTEGELWAFTIAGTLSTKESPVSSSGTNPLSGSSNPVQGAASAGQSGLGIAGAVSINLIEDNTLAYVNTLGDIKADELSVDALSDVSVVSATGAAAVVLSSGSQGDKAFAGAFSLNLLDTQTRAMVQQASVEAHGPTLPPNGPRREDLSVTAERTGDLISISAGGAVATGQNSNSVAGSVSVNIVSSDTIALVDGVNGDVMGDVRVNSSDDTIIVAVGGGVAVAVGGKAGVGIGVGANIMGSDADPNITRASIENSTLTIGGETLEVTATADDPDADARIYAIGAGVGVSTGPSSEAGVGAMLSVNLITNNTEAYIKSSTISEKLDSNNAAIAPAMDTLVQARDDSGIIALAGAVGVSTGGTAIGAAIGYNEIDNDILAELDDTSLTADGNLTIEASSDAEIGGVAVGVAANAGSGGKLTGAGSILINQITNTISAQIVDTVGAADRAIEVGGNVDMDAKDDSLVVSIAGGVAVAGSGTAAVGAAVSFNLIENQITTAIDGATVHATGSASTIDLDSESSATLVAIAVGAAGGNSTFSLGGSITINSIANSVDAHISNSTLVQAGDDIALKAAESDTLVVLAGGLTFNFGNTAVGVAIAYNYMGASFDAANPDVVSRDDGASDQITAYIQDAHVVAGGDLRVEAGFLASEDALPTSVTVSDETITLPDLVNAQVVSVTLGAAVSGQTAVGGSISINVVAHDISAYIAGAQAVEAIGSILVSAVDRVQMTSAAGGVAVSNSGLGAAVALQIDKSKVNAYVGAGTQLDAKGNGDGVAMPVGTLDSSGTPQGEVVKGLGVSATAFENNNTVAIGLAGGARFGVAGSGGVTVLAREVNAYIGENAQINQGTTGEGADQSVYVLASDRTEQVGVAGSIALGGIAGVGAGIDVDVISKSTQAWIASGAQVQAERDVRVLAYSEEQLVSVAAAGAGGLSVGIAGAVDVSVITVTTKAFIEGSKTVDSTDYLGATVFAGDSVQVAAEAATEIDIISGSVAAGGPAGIGGAIVVPIVTKNTYAFIGDGATVDALANKAGITVKTGTFTIGNEDYPTFDGTVVFDQVDGAADTITRSDGVNWEDEGFAARQAIEISATGDNNSRFIIDHIDGATIYLTDGDGDDLLTDETSNAVIVASDPDNVVPVSISQTDVGRDPSDDEEDPAEANPIVDEQFLGQRKATADSRANFKGVAVTAINQDDIGAYGVGAAGSGTVAVQISADVHVMTVNTSAYIDNNARVNDADNNEGADQSVLVAAGNDYQHLGVAGGAAIAGAVGVTPGVELSIVNVTTKAYVGETAVVEATKNVEVRARSAEDVLGIGIAIGASGAVGVGGAVSVFVLNSETYASIDDGSTVAAGGNLLIVATDDTDVDLVTIAAGIGIGAAGVGAGVGVTVINKDTQAWIGDATVDAKGNSTAMSVYDGTLDDSGIFGLTDSADDVRGVAVVAESSENILTFAMAGAGGLGAGVAGSVTVEIVDSDTRAYIDAGAEINSDATGANANQDVHVAAVNDLTILAMSGAIGIGTAGLAGGVDVGIVRNDTNAYIAGDVSAQRDVAVSALANKEIQSYVISAGGGGVGLGAAVSVYALGGDLVSSYSYQDSDDPENTLESESDDGDTDIVGGVDDLLTASDASSALGSVASPGNDSDGNAAGTTANSGDISGAASSTQTSLDSATPDSALSGSTSSSARAGTIAFIDQGATITAGRHVDLDARERIDLQMIGGGLGIGGAGVGAGIVILSVNDNVTAFIGGGATISAATIDPLGNVSVDASLTADYTLVAVTGGFGLVAGIAGAVVVFNDTSDVSAYIADGSTSAGAARILSAHAVNINATRDVSIHSSTAGAAGGLGLSVGAAVNLVTVDSTTQATIGERTEIGDDTQAMPTVSNVSVIANSFTSIGDVSGLDTMAAGIAIGTAASGSAGIAIVSIDSDVAAEIGEDVSIDIDGQVTVQAVSNSEMEVSADGLAAAALAVGVMLAEGEIAGTTKARVRSGTRVRGGSLSVTASDNSLANVSTVATGGGILAGQGSVSRSTVDSEVSAILEDVDVDVSGDIDIIATSGAEGDADAEGAGGAGINVGVSIAEVTLKPTVESYIGTDAIIVAGGNLTVQAISGQAAVPPDDSIVAADVNTTDDSLTFTDHGLRDGNTVVYSNPDADADIGGLSSGRDYHVLKVDEDNIQLGERFDAGLDINGLTDTITFAGGHKFRDGDRVVYVNATTNSDIGGLHSGSVYVVEVIDSDTIKLRDPNVTLAAAKTFAAGSAVDSATDVITITGHGFVDGQAVTYHAPVAKTFTSNLVDVALNASGELEPSDNDIIYLENHGFQTGDLLRYDVRDDGTAIGGLTAGDDYYAINAGVNELQLAGEGTSFDGSGAGIVNVGDNTILTAVGYQNGDKVIYRNGGGTSIGGLTDKGVYYVGAVSGNTVKLFNSQGDAVAGTNAIDLTALGTGSEHRLDKKIALTPGNNAVHTLIRSADLPITNLVDGVTYYVQLDTIAAADQANKFKLSDRNGNIIDISASGLSTSALHSLGTEGVDLTSSSGTHTLRIDLTSAAVGTDKLLGPGGISLSLLSPSSGDNTSSAAAAGSSGALITVGVNSATVNVTPTVSAYIAATSVKLGDAETGSDGNLTLESRNVINVSANGSNGSGGLVAVGVASASIDISAPEDTDGNPLDVKSAYIGAGTVIDAAGDVAILADLDMDVDSNVDVNGGGLAAASDSTSTVSIDYTNKAVVQDGAQITAMGDISIGADTYIVGSSRADADASGGGSGSNATATLDIEDLSVTETSVGANGRLVGANATLSAIVSGLDLTATAEAQANALLAFTDADAQVNVSDAANVMLGARAWVEGSSVDLLARHTGIDVTSTAEAISNGLGDATAAPTTDYESNSGVDVDDGATVAGNDVSVIAEQIITTYSRTRTATAGGTTGGERGGDFNARRSIVFDGDIALLIRPNPELFIDEDGVILTAQNITVNNGQLSGIVSGTSISVDNIGNLSNAGTALLQANTVADQETDQEDGPVSAPESTISGTTGAVRVKTTYDAITIINRSGKDLLINNISPANPNATGAITLDAESLAVDFGFDIADSSGPTLITIDNESVLGSNVVIQGLIDNPTGRTVILNAGGTITDSGSGTIRTNALDMEADAIGSLANRLDVELVRSVNRPTDMSADSQGGIYLDLTGRLRDVNGANAIFDTSELSAGGDIDLLINPSVQETTPVGNVAGIQITVTQDSSLSGPYVNRFHPDSGPATALDPAIYADTSLATAIASGYDFGQLTAGGNIVVKAQDAAAGATRVDVTAGTDILGTGYLDFLTNGDIDITESDGDLRIFKIQSNAGDVSLSAADAVEGSIYDIRDGATDNGSTPWVIGNNITLRAEQGAIGFIDDFLEINSNGVVNAYAYDLLANDQGVFLKETSGDLNIDAILSQDGDVMLVTLSGSILEAGSDEFADIQATNIDLVTTGGGIGASGNDVEIVGAGEFQVHDSSLDIDPIAPGVGRLYVDADNSVYLKEVIGALYVLEVTSAQGAVRLTAFDSARPNENIEPLTGGQTQLGAAITEGLVDAPLAVELWAGDDIDVPDGARVHSNLSVLLRGDAQSDDPELDPDVDGTTIDILGRVEAPNVEIGGGSDLDYLQINNPLGINPNGNTTMRGHDGGDRLFIRAVAGPTTLKGDEGSDRFFVSSNANKALFTIGGIYGDSDALDRLTGTLSNLGGLTIETGEGGNQGTLDGIFLSADGAAAGLTGSIENNSTTGVGSISGLGMTGTIAFSTASFNGSSSSVVDVTNNTIQSGGSFQDGDEVIYRNGGGTSIGGLTHNGIYYVKVISSTANGSTVKLFSSSADALAGTNPIDLTALGSGSQHQLHPTSKGLGVQVLVDLSSHNDSFQVKGLNATAQLFVYGGAGNDTLRAGNDSNSVAGISGIVGFFGEGGSGDTLDVYGDAPAAASGQLSGISVTGMGMGRNDFGAVHNDFFGAGYDVGQADYPAAIYYAQREPGGQSVTGTVENVHVRLGSGNDIFKVDSTYAGATTFIHGGAGEDTITVGSTPTGLNPNSLSRVDFIAGALHLDGEADTDTIVVDDSGDDNANVGTYTGNAVTGLDLPSTGSIVFDTADNITIQLGAQADTFYVPTTNANLTTTLKTGGGFDKVYVGTVQGQESAGSLSNLLGLFKIDGEGPEADDELFINDQSATTGRQFRITNNLGPQVTLEDGTLWNHDTTTVSLNGTAIISYQRMETVALNAGTGADTINLEKTHREQAVAGKNATFTVNAGGGADTINIGEPVTGGYSLASFAISTSSSNLNTTRAIPVFVNGQGGNDVVHVKDTASTNDVGLAFVNETFDDLFPSLPRTFSSVDVDVQITNGTPGADAASANNIYLETHGFQTGDVVRYEIESQPAFDGSSADVVSLANDTIQIDGNLRAGDQVIYRNGGGTSIGGLSNETAYYVGAVSENLVKLFATRSAAIAGTNAINITSLGSGTRHVLVKMATTPFDGSGASVVDLANDTIVTAGGYQAGDQVIYRNGGGTSIGGLTDDGVYYVGAISGNLIKLFSTSAAALAGTTPIDLTALGSGDNHTIERAFDGSSSSVVSVTNDTIQIAGSYQAGDQVVYRNGGGGSIGGLTNDGVYYVGAITGNTVKLFSTRVAAIAGTSAINLTSLGSGNRHQLLGSGDPIGGLTPGQDYYVIKVGANELQLASAGTPFDASSVSVVFDGSSVNVVDLTNDTIQIGGSFQAGDEVVYRNGGGTSIGGLNNNGTYYVGAVSGNVVRLFSSNADALAGTNAIDFTALGAGNQHQFQRGSSGSNTGVVDLTQDRIRTAGGYAVGDKVIYSNGGGTSIGGLTDKGVYYIGALSGNTVKLFTSSANALAGTNAVNLTSRGSGSQHRLDKQIALTPQKTDAADRDTVHTLSADPAWVSVLSRIFGADPEAVAYTTLALTDPVTSSNPVNIHAFNADHVMASLGAGEDVVQLTGGVYSANITVDGGAAKDTFNVEQGVDNRGFMATFNGEAGDDLLFAFDDGDGDSVLSPDVVVPNGKVFVTFNGGANGSDGDMLRIAGDGVASGTYRPSSTVARAGDVTVRSNEFHFTGVEPLVVNGLSDFDVLTPDDPALLAVDSIRVEDLNLDRLVLHAVTVDGVVSWTQDAKLVAPVTFDTRHMGKASDISGNTLAVGAEFQGTAFGSIGGLIDEGVYYVGAASGNSFKLFTSAADATAGTNPVDISALGSGSRHLLVKQSSVFDGSSESVVDRTNNTILTTGGYQAGDQVIYRNGGGTSSGGLSHDDVYYVGAVSGNLVKLFLTRAAAIAGSSTAAIDLTSLGTGSQHRLIEQVEFNGSSASVVSLDNDTITTTHGFQAGDEVTYSNGSGIDGVVYVYTWDTNLGRWVEQAKLDADDDLGAGQGFGSALSIDGSILIVGAPQDNSEGTDTGAAYVFVRDTTTGAWQKEAKLTANDASANSKFGQSVAVSGSSVIIGAGGSTDAAYVFVRSGTTWSQQQKITRSGDSTSDFGAAVTISGNTAAIGDPISGSTDVGAVYVYTRSGTSWSSAATLNPSEPDDGELFGAALDMISGTIVVGSPLWDGFHWAQNQTFSEVGRAFVFEGSGSSWTLTARLTAFGGLPEADALNQGKAGDHFGSAVAINGNYVVVGAPGVDGSQGLDLGAAYAFYRYADQGSGLGASWTRATGASGSGILQAASPAGDDPIGGEFGTADRFGTSVAIGNGRIVIGLPGYNETTSSGNTARADVGAVRTYSTDGTVPTFSTTGVFAELIKDPAPPGLPSSDHTFGSVSFYDPTSRMLIIGDPERDMVYTYINEGLYWRPV